MTGSQLTVIETTNGVFNMSLYDLISPNSVPYWIRVTVANRLATTAGEWHDIFYQHNSGTCKSKRRRGEKKEEDMERKRRTRRAANKRHVHVELLRSLIFPTLG
mgnify:CR=1 FL=1